MTTYQRRAKWIRRMQDRAGRRREREWARQATPAFSLWSEGVWATGSRRAA
jgi:hypothetical protein